MAPTDAAGAEGSATESDATQSQNATEQPGSANEAQTNAAGAEGEAAIDPAQAVAADADAATKELIDALTPIIQAEVQKATTAITNDLLVIVGNLEKRIEAAAPTEIARIADDAKAAVDALAARLKDFL